MRRASLSGYGSVAGVVLRRRVPNLNLFPTAIQNGHINLIIRCVIRLADERLSLDGIKSVCPLFVDRHRSIKLGRATVMAHSTSTDAAVSTLRALNKIIFDEL